jgi:hypothetical protein
LKAALLFEKDDIRIVDLPMPMVGPKDILLHVKSRAMTDIVKAYEMIEKKEALSIVLTP